MENIYIKSFHINVSIVLSSCLERVWYIVLYMFVSYKINKEKGKNSLGNLYLPFFG